MRIVPLDEKERMRPAEREAYQVTWLRSLVDHAYRNAPAVRALFDGAGVRPDEIQGIADLARLPITKKHHLLEIQAANPPFGGYLAVPLEELDYIFISPGPIYDPITFDRAEGAALLRLLGVMGIGKGDRVLNTWSYHLVPAGLGLDHALRAMGATVIPSGVGMTDLQATLLRDLKITAIFASTAFFTALMMKTQEMGLDPKRDLSVRVAFIGGEASPGFPARRRALEEEYGVSTFCAYATADVGIIGYECEEKNGYHMAEDCIVEILDPVTGRSLPVGEVGEVVVTPSKRTYPLIRFGTGDASFVMPEPCSCGRTSLRLGPIMGRVGDAVKVREIFVYPTQIDHVLARFPQVAKGQAAVRRNDLREELHLRVELVEEGADRAAIEAGLCEVFPSVCTVRADRVEFLSPGTLPDDYRKIVDEKDK